MVKISAANKRRKLYLTTLSGDNWKMDADYDVGDDRTLFCDFGSSIEERNDSYNENYLAYTRWEQGRIVDRG